MILSVEILEKNQEKISSLVNTYQKKSQKGASFFLMFINLLISILSGIENFIKGFLGMFSGYGILGLLFVFILILMSLMVSIYIFMFVAPLYLLAYIIRYKRTNIELISLQNVILSGL